MAILILNRTICPICGTTICSDQNAICFPAFVSNELDPLIGFSDTAFHKECILQHPLGHNAILMSDIMKHKSIPKNWQCDYCKQSITSPSDYFSFGYLTSNEADPLFAYNYVQLHQSCLAQWPKRLHVKQLLENLNDASRWKGKSLQWTINQLM